MASPDDLRFQEFGSKGKETKLNLDTDSADEGFKHEFTKFPDSARDDEQQLLSEGQPKGETAFWTFKFYQQFFDVETDQVKARILYSMFPKMGQSHLEYHVRPKPDLYGPFWVCVTLVFSIAISGNISNYLQTAGTSGKYVWKYDFHKVSYAATSVFFYVWVLPIFLYLAFAWKKSTQITFLEILCVYGYSLCIYVPISVLWVIQVRWIQWLLVLVGSAVSGAVLVQSLWPSLKPTETDDAAKSWSSWALVGIVAFMHLLLAVGFMLYFFHVPATAVAAGMAPAVQVTPVAPVTEKAIKEEPKLPSGALKQNATEVKDQVRRRSADSVEKELRKTNAGNVTKSTNQEEKTVEKSAITTNETTKESGQAVKRRSIPFGKRSPVVT